MRAALRNISLPIGIGFLLLLFVFAAFGPGIRTSQLQTPDQKGFDAVFFAVGKPYEPPQTPGKPLGTDELGRDEIARLAQGAQVSLLVGFVVQILALAVGITMGMSGVFAPRWLRAPILRFTDAMFAFPDILLGILIIGTMAGTGSGSQGNVPFAELKEVLPVIVALAITAWPSVTRLTVTQVASAKDREYVIAARAAGASTPYLILKHILPQVIPLILAVSMVDMAGTVLAESTLSFIGIGVQPPNPSWGNMINDVRSGDITSHVPQLLFPCVLLSFTIFALNFVGDGLLAVLDPKGR